ncbi:MAG: class II aldolase/adducin family protein [Actinobacteria bacterium]|nr:class II aldolase/adducin family protein [Actinomycetota bacterium]
MEPMAMEAMKEVLKTGQELARRGLVAGTSGNCSARVPGSDLIVITPSSMEYELLLAEDMCVVNMDREKVEGRYDPSVEVIMHLAIYKAREDVGGIVHTHQKMASAVAVVGKGIPPILEEEVFALGGGIELAEYALPGTEDLARNAVEALGGRNACLLPHHGVVAVGPRIQDALLKAEIVERAAEIYIMASMIGSPQIVPFMQKDAK